MQKQVADIGSIVTRIDKKVENTSVNASFGATSFPSSPRSLPWNPAPEIEIQSASLKRKLNSSALAFFPSKQRKGDDSAPIVTTPESTPSTIAIATTATATATATTTTTTVSSPSTAASPIFTLLDSSSPLPDLTAVSQPAVRLKTGAFSSASKQKSTSSALDSSTPILTSHPVSLPTLLPSLVSSSASTTYLPVLPPAAPASSSTPVSLPETPLVAPASSSTPVSLTGLPQATPRSSSLPVSLLVTSSSSSSSSASSSASTSSLTSSSLSLAPYLLSSVSSANRLRIDRSIVSQNPISSSQSSSISETKKTESTPKPASEVTKSAFSVSQGCLPGSSISLSVAPPPPFSSLFTLPPPLDPVAVIHISHPPLSPLFAPPRSFADNVAGLRDNGGQWRTKTRRKGRQQTSVGTNRNAILKAVPPESKIYGQFAIYRLEDKTTADSVRRHLHEKGIEVANVWMLGSSINGTKTAKVRVAKAHEDRAKDPSIWPLHCRIRDWDESKTRGQKQRPNQGNSASSV